MKLRVAGLSMLIGLLLTVASSAAFVAHSSARSDGSRIAWQIDLPDGGHPVGLVVLAQGSGCLPARKSQSLQVARAALSEYAALVVDKYGVDPKDAPTDSSTDCSDSYFAHATMTQRIKDYAAILSELRGASWWNGELTLFGGSEGGLVMARLAGQVNADAAILVSAAPGVSFGDVVRLAIPKEGWPTVDAAFERARQDPQSLEKWGGYPYRFWADAIDHRAVDDMLKAKTAFLEIQGGRDPVPVSAARAASDLFIAGDRCNLTYWEFPAYDHGMVDSAGVSHMQAVLTLSAAWLQQQLTAQSPCGPGT